MTTLTIQISDEDRDLFEKLVKRLNVKIIKIVEGHVVPNNITKRAIASARAGKTKKIENLDLFFKEL